MTEAERRVEADKQRLIKQGEIYRMTSLHAKAQLAEALHPDRLFLGAVDQAVGVAQARFGSLLQPGGLSGINFRSLMPYALTIGSFLARKRLVKPALAVGALLAAGAAVLVRYKRSH
ncbi:hypothetical protein ACLB1G_20490 [Oxalobacteraceae bacterium A2-2]